MKKQHYTFLYVCTQCKKTDIKTRPKSIPKVHPNQTPYVQGYKPSRFNCLRGIHFFEYKGEIV